uniref:Uncharacterized protein n=1 Tax=Timspurckia oligopyrenoides TaxID=708627 RepID=A0A7S1ETK0_9RHOD
MIQHDAGQYIIHSRQYLDRISFDSLQHQLSLDSLISAHQIRSVTCSILSHTHSKSFLWTPIYNILHQLIPIPSKSNSKHSFSEMQSNPATSLRVTNSNAALYIYIGLLYLPLDPSAPSLSDSEEVELNEKYRDFKSTIEVGDFERNVYRLNDNYSVYLEEVTCKMERLFTTVVKFHQARVRCESLILQGSGSESGMRFVDDEIDGRFYEVSERNSKCNRYLVQKVNEIRSHLGIHADSEYDLIADVLCVVWILCTKDEIYVMIKCIQFRMRLTQVERVLGRNISVIDEEFRMDQSDIQEYVDVVANITHSQRERKPFERSAEILASKIFQNLQLQQSANQNPPKTTQNPPNPSKSPTKSELFQQLTEILTFQVTHYRPGSFRFTKTIPYAISQTNQRVRLFHILVNTYISFFSQ